MTADSPHFNAGSTSPRMLHTQRLRSQAWATPWLAAAPQAGMVGLPARRHDCAQEGHDMQHRCRPSLVPARCATRRQSRHQQQLPREALAVPWLAVALQAGMVALRAGSIRTQEGHGMQHRCRASFEPACCAACRQSRPPGWQCPGCLGFWQRSLRLHGI